MHKQNDTIIRELMQSLWVNWTIVIVVICAVLVLPFITSKMWMPLIIMVMSYMLLRRSRHNSIAEHLPNCVLVVRIGMLSLFWSTIVMALINLLNTRMLLDGLIDWSNSNHEIPYITGLVLFPIIAAVCSYEYLRGFNTKFCRKCQLYHGFDRSSNVITSIYSRESRYQVKLLMYLSFATALVQYWYYFVYYMNVNLNAPDRFFFNYMPIALYLFSTFIMKMRYNNMAYIIGPISTSDNTEGSARILIISGDYILLNYNSAGRLDTPLTLRLENINKTDREAEIRRNIDDISGLNFDSLRFLYSNKSHNMLTPIYHYAAILPDGRNNGKIDGEWYTIDSVEDYIKSANVATDLSDEIFRIFTITMAWKTYDRNGYRLYPVKKYHPQFHLRDLKNWTVDYNDTTWFNVADNNEDRPFFHIRRLWKRFTGQ